VTRTWSNTLELGDQATSQSWVESSFDLLHGKLTPEALDDLFGDVQGWDLRTTDRLLGPQLFGAYAPLPRPKPSVVALAVRGRTADRMNKERTDASMR
jgi:hypothetical protein